MAQNEMNGTIAVLVREPAVLAYDEQAVIIMDVEKPVWIKTSSTGQWIYEQLLAHDYTAKGIVSRTADYFSLPESAVEQSVLDLLQNLMADGFIRFNGDRETKQSSPQPLHAGAQSSFYQDDLPAHGLVSVWFNILSQCNLSCPHCFLPEQEASRPISVERAKIILDILAKRDVKRLYISGGEPLIHPHVLDIVRYARQIASWQIIIITNGFSNDRELIEKLSDLVDYFQISLDGTDAETHNTVRGENSFENASKFFNVVNEAKSRARTGLSFTPLPENIEQLPHLLTLALKLQADAIYVTKPKRPSRNFSADDARFEEFLSVEFRRKILDKYDEMVKNHMKFTKDTSTVRSVKAPVLDPSFDSALNLLLCTKRGCCSAGGNTLFIDEQGNCYPCSALNQPQHRLGNILEEPFETVYDERAVKGFRQSIHVDKIAECRECPFKYFCAGDCRALTNDVKARTPYCELIKERYGRFLKGVRLQGDRKAI